jgi:hypothetical protein
VRLFTNRSQGIKKNTKKLKVKLVAIARNEAAYIPEWVFHHLYFGFDEIEILVNRTSDSSNQILALLNKENGKVKYQYCDWIDWCPDNVPNAMQFVAYAQAVHKEQMAMQFDYIMFLDIDEFWTPQNMKSPIQQFISRHSNPSSVSFGWINEHGSNHEFSSIKKSTTGQLSPLVKTVFSLQSKVSKISLHLPEMEGGNNVLADGISFVPDIKNRECLHADLVMLRDAMIVHRMFRSPKEYLSLLLKGRPSDSYSIKLNRGGYNLASGAHVTFNVDQENFKKYDQEKARFLSKTILSEAIDGAKYEVLGRVDKFVDSVCELPIDKSIQLLTVLKGCDEQLLKKIVTEIVSKIKQHGSQDKELLFTLANSIKPIDSDLAKVLIRQSI